MRCGEHNANRGFTFVIVLLLLAVVSLGLAIAGPSWAQQAQRERERELLRVGALYANALANYRIASPGSLKQYPATLQALVLDTRFVGTMRHLRKLYPDPVNPRQPWGLILDDAGRIVGVHSQSSEAPLAEGGITIGALVLPAARQYADWKFVAKVPL